MAAGDGEALDICVLEGERDTRLADVLRDTDETCAVAPQFRFESTDAATHRSAEPQSLGQILDGVDAAARSHDPVSVGDVLDAVGDRSFAPLLIVPGLVMLAPIVGDVPGVPVIMGALVFLTAAQLLMRRDHVWLPDWMLRRSVSSGKVEKTAGWMRPVARFLDGLSKPRLTRLVSRTGRSVIAIACIAVAAATPVMEVVPFSANVAGAAIVAFGLALLTRDGLLALVAVVCVVAVAGLVGYGLR